MSARKEPGVSGIVAETRVSRESALQSAIDESQRMRAASWCDSRPPTFGCELSKGGRGVSEGGMSSEMGRSRRAGKRLATAGEGMRGEVDRRWTHRSDTNLSRSKSMLAPEAIATKVWSRRLVLEQYAFIPAIASAPTDCERLGKEGESRWGRVLMWE